MRSSAPLVRRSAEPFRARIPGSKSCTQRALVLAALRPGTTRVEGALFSADTEALAHALGRFGGLVVSRAGSAFVVGREAGVLRAPRETLSVGGAATAARFLLAFASTAEGATVVTGERRLTERPMQDGLDALASLGVRCECLGAPGRLPVRVHGRGGGDVAAGAGGREWRVRAGTSSQFASALCLLAAQSPGSPVHIALEGEPVSAPYLDLTLAMLRASGVEAYRAGPRALVVEPATPTAALLVVEPDASSASYLLAAAAATGTTVDVPGLGARSAQGDVACVRLLERMGCAVELGADSVRVAGGPLRGLAADLTETPDVVPTLAALAAVAEGPTRLAGLSHLRHKESDRVRALARGLERLGARVEEGAGSLAVVPPARLRPARVETHDDHRLAMAFAVLGLVAPGIEVDDPGCVAKSFPGFWRELERFRAHHEGA